MGYTYGFLSTNAGTYLDMGKHYGHKLQQNTTKHEPRVLLFNTLRPRQNGRYFAEDIFKCIFLNENAWISLKISLNIPALVQIMAWRRPGDKPLSEPMMVSLLMHICVTRPQWVNTSGFVIFLTWSSKVIFVFPVVEEHMREQGM